ncbi:MAG TPA: thiamine diphosphokinase [Tepidisphaeraceae bacterium]|nr:thiamine diphosphokinase [Tepidisphaeraceae bacterium]
MIAVILCNGEQPSDELLLRHLQAAELVICTDGAIGWVEERGCEPGVVIGDMDSWGEADGKLKTCPTREIIHCGAHDQQENTDAEKALLLALERGARRVVMLGATGQRLDHTLGNVALAAKYRDRAEIVLADDHGELKVIDGRNVIATDAGTVFSLVPLTVDVTLDTEGLKWPLHGPLEVGTRGLSNEALESEVVIDLHSGVVALITMAPAEDAS